MKANAAAAKPVGGGGGAGTAATAGNASAAASSGAVGVGLNEDTLGGILKASLSQYLALEIAKGNGKDSRCETLLAFKTYQLLSERSICSDSWVGLFRQHVQLSNFCTRPSRNRQSAEQPKSKTTQPNSLYHNDVRRRQG